MAESGAEAHRTSVVVWDVPSTLESGEKFSVKLGVKCSSECPPDGWTVEVRDQDGGQRATTTLSAEPSPGTAALHCAEVDLSAPETEGLHQWEATLRVEGLEIPHSACLAQFGVRVVPAPEYLLTVVVMDQESRTPVVGAKVAAHPYSTLTDGLGVAEMRLPKGEYRLFVSGKKYFPFRSDGEMKADVTLRVELALDPELSDADIWV